MRSLVLVLVGILVLSATFVSAWTLPPEYKGYILSPGPYKGYPTVDRWDRLLLINGWMWQMIGPNDRDRLDEYIGRAVAIQFGRPKQYDRGTAGVLTSVTYVETPKHLPPYAVLDIAAASPELKLVQGTTPEFATELINTGTAPLQLFTVNLGGVLIASGTPAADLKPLDFQCVELEKFVPGAGTYCSWVYNATGPESFTLQPQEKKPFTWKATAALPVGQYEAYTYYGFGTNYRDYTKITPLVKLDILAKK